MSAYILLLIARSQTLATRLQSYLDGEPCSVRWASSVSQATVLDVQPDLVILDLPSSGGARALARAKKRFPVPFLALSDGDRKAPDGAAAVLSRPFQLADLAQLVQAARMDAGPNVLRAGGMSLDTDTRRLRFNGALYQLPPTACQIAAVLMKHVDSVVSRDELFRSVWQTEHRDSSRALDVHIAGLRRLIEPDPRRPQMFLTERGVGYRFHPPKSS